MQPTATEPTQYDPPSTNRTEPRSRGAVRATGPRGSSHESIILALLCLAQFMVVLDVSVVNVALPAIRGSLGFSETGLAWVVNAYTIAFAGFLLLGGRAADLFGRRRIFLLGLAMFTGASLLGGFSQDQGMLVAARILQGLGGAVLSPATLTLLITTFPEGPKRARALGLWSALAGAGGAAGALLGGILTDTVGWRWILFINVPIGLIALVAGRIYLTDTKDRSVRRLDVLGAVLVTGGLMALVYAIVGTDTHSWGSLQTVSTLALAVVLLGAFLAEQLHFAKAPLMPVALFKLRSVNAANIVMLLVGAAIFATWYFLSLYMQGVLHYSPLQAGLAFVPQTVAIIVGAQIASRLVMRIGARPLLLIGTTLSFIGLLWLGRVSADGHFWSTLFVPGSLVTLGVGLSFTPLAVAATAGVPPQLSGLSSGLINTTRQVGGAVGLAVLATLQTAHTVALQRTGVPLGEAMSRGYGRAFIVSAGIALLAMIAASMLPGRPPAPAVAPARG